MKIIKVTGCHDCPGRQCNGILSNEELYNFHKSKTIHPDCPLDDYEETDK